jgi:hypothetical protein
MGVEKQITRILESTPDGSDERFVQLKQLARRLSCSVSSWRGSKVLEEPDLLQRIREGARARREERLWIVAALSATASIFAAAAAWTAVLLR